MHQIDIKENEAGQRLDKFLHKYLPLAPASFFYKMLRKKNITLNGKRAEGKEKLSVGDQISFFLSDDTIKGFQNAAPALNEFERAYQELTEISLIYEDENILVMNKPEGILSQKSKETDISLNEWMIGYLLSSGSLNKAQLATFKPSVCNRLDRNTCGLIIGAKSLQGSQKMNELIRHRNIRKFYRLFVKGRIEKEETLEGYLVKDERLNKVCILHDTVSDQAAYIKTRYYPLQIFNDRTLVEVELITGKSHQIRAHMASISHPLLGDYKYGDQAWNDFYKRKYQISSQMLYACRLEFGQMKEPFQALDGRVIEAPVPAKFQRLLKQE